MHRVCAGRSLALSVLLVCLPGCATEFTAKRANPLRPAPTPAWEPGEISPASASVLKELAGNWHKYPAEAVRRLDAQAAKNAVVRRAAIEVALRAGMRSQDRFFKSPDSAGFYLYALETAQAGGAGADSNFDAQVSRFALARLVDLRNRLLENGRQPASVVPGPTQNYRVRVATETPGAQNPDRFEHVIPTDRYQLVRPPKLATVEGIGTPLAVEIKGPRMSTAAEQFVLPDGAWQAATLVADFGRARDGAREVTFTIFDPKATPSVMLNGRRQQLAADYTTPFAVKTAELNQGWLTLGLLGFLSGENYLDSTGLYPGETVKKDKIPVVFVHGLISEPNDWRFIWNDLLADPKIRENYQFWSFYYPTSLPVPWSSMLLRESLDHAMKVANPGKKYPKLDRMVLISHSMGGLLTRMQISEGGENWYGDFFSRPIDELRMFPSQRETIQKMLYFKPNPDIDEVVFMCVPHRGSELAVGFIGRIGRLLVHLPRTVIETTLNVLTLNADALASDAKIGVTTSIDSLGAGSRFVTLLEKLPMDSKVHKHSIIGDRGKGDTPHSSDGVVPYWSSHIEPVASEKIIPSGHSALANPEAAAEIKRILVKNLEH